MRRTILRALILAAAVVSVSLVVDLLYSVVHQGGPARGRTREFLVFRSALHGATLVLTAVGAAAGFAFLRSYAISNARIVLLGSALGLVTVAAVLGALKVGGFRAVAAWLVLSSGVVAYSGGMALGTQEANV